MSTEQNLLDEFASPRDAGLALQSDSTPSASGFSQLAAASPDSNLASRLMHAYEEFCRRSDQGESVDPDDFCAQFPHMKSNLGRLLQAQLFLEENRALVAETPNVRGPEPGSTFLDYRLIAKLGQGAFAHVYLAAEPKLGNRLVVVKISRYGGAEAEVLGRIVHPNIVPIYSIQEDAATGLTAICMPYLGSATLCNVLDRAFAPGKPVERARVILEEAGALPFPLDASARRPMPDRVLRHGTFIDGVRWLGAKLADALAYLHEKKIYHRDLKPSNVLLSPEGEPMLLDFNLCADAQETIHWLGGTLPYMPPEQLRATDLEAQGDPAAMDARSDIYALGVILYQLATGEHPYGPLPLKMGIKQLRAHLLQRQGQGSTEARRVNPKVDAAFSRLLQRCLACDPKDRPQTAAEVGRELRRQMAAPRRLQRWVGRHPIQTLTAAALLVAAFGTAAMIAAPVGPPLGISQLERGMRAYQEGRYSEAIEHVNDVLRADPRDAAALFARGRARQQLGQFSLAYDDFAQADKISPDGRNLACMGYCLNRMNLPVAAMAHYLKGLRMNYDSAEVHNNLGYSLMRGNQLTQGKEHLDLAIDRDSRLQAAFHNRAVWVLVKWQAKLPALGAHSQKDDVYLSLLDGIKDIQQALKIGPGSAELSVDAARLYAVAALVERKWTLDAIAHLEEALRQDCNPKVTNDVVFSVLRDDGSFKKLRPKPAAAKWTAPPTRRIVDPIHDRGN